TFHDFELIIVDDASRDETPAAVAGFQDHRIRYIRHEQNRGEAQARNKGVTTAQGSYIAFLDDDDEWLPEKLALQVHLLENSPRTVGGVYTGRLTLDGKSKKVTSVLRPTKKGDLLQTLLREGNCITLSSVLLRKECFEKVGLFDEQTGYSSDYDMWIRISGAYHFECIAEPLVKYTVHRESLSRDLSRVLRGNEAVLNKHKAYFLQDNQAYSRLCAELSIMYYFNRNSQKGRQLFLQAIQAYPFPTRNYLTCAGLALLGVEKYQKLQKIKRALLRDNTEPEQSVS
ncbi:MAG: glycosyltransferase, partial [Candidatus Binatia bacterium]|nr:glycosyltransferase [Candidatus Binatia bacterium]